LADWVTAGYVFNTTATNGAFYVDIRVNGTTPWSRATTLWNQAGNWKIEQPWQGIQAGGRYDFRVCYDRDQGGALAEVCGPIQTFTRPGGADSTRPDTTIAAKPALFTNQTSASFTFNSTELGSSFRCKLDGGVYSGCSAPTFTGLAAGPHTLLVYARDLAGNDDLSPASYSWTIDLTNPNTTVTRVTIVRRTAKVLMTSNEPGTFQCKLDGGAFKPCASGKTFTNLRVGSHTIRVRAKDRAGNLDPTPAAKTFRIR
jgi:hypothetical protein